MKKLPEFIIKGSLQELIEIEPLLVMSGYDKYLEGPTNLSECNKIYLYGDGRYVYRKFKILDKRKILNAHETHKILYYIETGRVKNFKEDKKFCHIFDALENESTIGEKIMENLVINLYKSKSEKKTKELLNKIGAVPYAFDNSRGLTKANPAKIKQVELAFNNWITDPIDGSKHEYTQEQKKEILAFIKSQI